MRNQSLKKRKQTRKVKTVKSMASVTDYNYIEAMKEDIKEYIKNEVTLSDYSDRDELEKHLNDTLWTEDSVTGNASGSYTFNTYKA